VRAVALRHQRAGERLAINRTADLHEPARPEELGHIVHHYARPRARVVALLNGHRTLSTRHLRLSHADELIAERAAEIAFALAFCATTSISPPSTRSMLTADTRRDMRSVGDRADGHRLRALIVLLWRAGLRISEALGLQESDLDRARGAVLVRRGKGCKRREVGMDRWAWGRLDPWLEIRRQLPIGALLCVIHGPTVGRRWEASAARKQLHHAATGAGVRRRFAPHQYADLRVKPIRHREALLIPVQRSDSSA
jgi:hypothetical protein